MLRSDTLFGKRESNSLNPALSASGMLGQTGAAKPISPASALGQHDSPKTVMAPTPEFGADETGSKLIVGPNIKLKGVEITDCDTIVVEGFVEATIYSRAIQIAQQGAFKGAAEIDIAEIRGTFDGELTVRQKLVIFSTGKVSGKIRYGKLVIEEGGQLSGDVQMNTVSSPKALAGGGFTAAKLAE